MDSIDSSDSAAHSGNRWPVFFRKEDAEKAALADERTAKYTEGKQIVKTIVVPGRIINIVVK